MLKGENVYALITARGGSKGVPKKNLYPVAGKPLILYTIEAGLGASDVDRVFVSSDDPDILAFSRLHGAETIERPLPLAQDDTPSDLVIDHALNVWRSSEGAPGYVLLLQPTSPLRTARDIEQAFQQFSARDADGLISVYVPRKSPLKAYLLDGNRFLKGIVEDRSSFRCRQDLPEVFMPNGALYLFSVESFAKQRGIPIERVIPFVMERKHSLDIDTLEDIHEAEAIMGQGIDA